MFTHQLRLVLTFSFLVWLGATLFFVLFGDAVLTDPAEEAFLPNFLLLEAGTALVLYLVFFLYQKLDRSQYAVIKLGIWGSAVGLLIDTISLWNHPLIFPALSKGQVIAFAIWMVCAYGMYLLIPLILSHKK
ncbi:YnzE [Bacillus subtilis subsp. subtilis str. RO-NN-1]|nr:YnzE [Bacillus subtilis subsp. subtilis str. RO-NN-1]